VLNGQQFSIPGLEHLAPAPRREVPGRVIDSGESAHRRQQANRDRITGAGNARVPFADQRDLTAPVSDYGLQEADWKVVKAVDPSLSAPHDTYNFRRHGATKFVNLVGEGAAQMSQDVVNPARVEQIRSNPETASDPRFPGRELPKAIEIPGVPHPIVVQGTHRTAEAISSGQMFTEMRTLDVTKREGLPPSIRRAQGQKIRHSAQRVVEGDPTAQYTGKVDFSIKLRDYEQRQGI
jgi:hypothetical protein